MAHPLDSTARQSAPPDFGLTTSLRWLALPSNTEHASNPDNLPQLDGIPLHFHRDRLLAAAKAFSWPVVISLLSEPSGIGHLHASIVSFSSTLPALGGTYKLRLTLAHTGAVNITASPPITSAIFPFSFPTTFPFTHPSQSPDDNPPLPKLYISPTPTACSLLTSHKTTNRTPYTDTSCASLPSSIASLPPTTAEILLYNSENQIMECVYSTPYFRRGEDVVTPAATSGGNLGVTRRLALEKGWCKEGVVSRDEVREGEVVVLSNAVRGFWVAKVALLEEPEGVTDDAERSAK